MEKAEHNSPARRGWDNLGDTHSKGSRFGNCGSGTRGLSRGQGGRALVCGVFVLVMLAGARSTPTHGEETTELSARRLMTAETDRAIRQGLEYLASHQHQNGSFGSGDMRGDVAVTSLAAMALMAGGSQPNRGPYGGEVDRALGFILANANENGYIAHSSGDQMYGHGFATLFLAECYGSSQRPELRRRLERAVQLIVNTQNSEGGWRYKPQRLDADISVTICQIMALRAARNAGIHVPRDTVDRCTEYVKQCQNPDGGFCYMLPGGESAFARSAAGVVALYSAGIYEGEEIESGLRYLEQFIPEAGTVRREPYYYYGHYYCVQAMWHRGGDLWVRYYTGIRDELISRQQPDGSWTNPFTPEYGTAMACLVLQLPNNYLPIFQR